MKRIQSLKKLLSKTKKLLFTSTALVFFTAVFIVPCLCAQNVVEKAVITGDSMEVRNNGAIMISRGNSKAVSGKNTIKANELRYNKASSLVNASGNVRLYSFTDDNEPVEASGKFAEYNLSKDSGKLWGQGSGIKYFMKESSAPLTLNAEEIYLDKNLEKLSAYKEVEVITSSGSIYSDNAVFDKKNESIEMEKDEKRPVADVFYDGRKGLYEADKMIFYNADDKKKIVMKGSVTGKIEMEDKIQWY